MMPTPLQLGKAHEAYDHAARAWEVTELRDGRYAVQQKKHMIMLEPPPEVRVFTSKNAAYYFLRDRILRAVLEAALSCEHDVEDAEVVSP